MNENENLNFTRSERTKLEYESFLVTINSNRYYANMDKATKIAFAKLCKEMLYDDLENYMVYRVWKTGYSNFRDQSANAPALDSKGDIKYLESKYSFESGKRTGKLHCHANIRVCANKYNGLGIYPFNKLFSLKYEALFEQKCHVDIKSMKDTSLGQKIYAIKDLIENRAINKELGSSDDLPKEVLIYNYERVDWN